MQIVIALKLTVQGAALRQPNPVIRVQSEELLGSLAHLTLSSRVAAKRSGVGSQVLDEGHQQDGSAGLRWLVCLGWANLWRM